jgi:uncharacterized membrane protein
VFWLYPAAGLVAALALAPLLRWVDGAVAWEGLRFTPEGASTVLGALVAAMLTFIVFVVSSLLIVVQLASAQLTPRIIALAFESRYIRYAVTLFSFSFAYTAAISGRAATNVPQIATATAVFTCVVSIAVFFRFANRLAVDLRPVSILMRVGTMGCEVIDAVYPAKLAGDHQEARRGAEPVVKPDAIVTHAASSGTVLAFDAAGILRIATQADAVVEMVPQVGDFVARGDALFRVASAGRARDEDALRGCVAVGPERTMEQDPRFAFRIIVDIANKALSPAINDPTTAVLAIDQIHRMLLLVGRRRLDEGSLGDAAGRVRLVYGTPDWEDFVCLGISEIRHFGAASIQVSRRLFALLTHLLQVLPPMRADALQRERRLLQQSVLRAFPDAEDRIRAQVADSQGVGGSEPIGEPSKLEVAQPGS